MIAASIFYATSVLVASPNAAASAPEPVTPTVVDRRGHPRRTPRLQPIVSVGSKLMFRSLVLEQGGATQRDRELMWKPAGLWLGAELYYRRGTSYATGGWRGDLSVGTELVTRTGSPILALQHTTGYDWHVRPRLSLFMGGRAVVAWDTLHPEASHAELGMPLGIGWRRAELQWIPALSLPLAHDRREVWDGEVRRGVAVNFMPLNVSLTVKLGRHPRQDRR